MSRLIVNVPVVENGVAHERKTDEVEISKEGLEQILDAAVRLALSPQHHTMNDLQNALKTYGVMR